MRFLLLIVLVLVGCDGDTCDLQPYEHEVLPLHIDTHCHEQHVEAIETAVNELNRVSASELCQPVIAIGEPVDVDHWAAEVQQGTISCYYEEPEWFQDTEKWVDKVGWSDYFENVRLFFWKTPLKHDNFSRALALHELGHYIGLDHVDDQDAVMSQGISSSHRRFTGSDVDEFVLRYK